MASRTTSTDKTADQATTRAAAADEAAQDGGQDGGQAPTDGHDEREQRDGTVTDAETGREQTGPVDRSELVGLAQRVERLERFLL